MGQVEPAAADADVNIPAKAKNMNNRQAVVPNHPHALYKEHGYSPAIRSGDLLFVSGMVGARPDGTPKPDLAKKIGLAFENLRGVLGAAGCTFGDVVDVTLFLLVGRRAVPRAYRTARCRSSRQDSPARFPPTGGQL